MADALLVFDNFEGSLKDLDGVLCGAALTTAAYIATTGDTTIDDIVGEATGTGYTRQTFTAVWDGFQVLRIADADDWPSFDTHALAVAHDSVVNYVADAGHPDYLKVISVLPFGTQAPTTTWLYEPVNGIARARRTTALPDPTGVDAGMVPMTDGADNYALGAAATVPGLIGATAGQVLTVDTPSTPPIWADLPANPPGPWTPITVPSPWANAGPLFSDSTMPLLGVRASVGGGNVDIQGRIVVLPSDLVSGLSSGAVTFSALVPAGFRPATKRASVVAVATVLASFSPSFFQLPLQAETNAAGDVTLGFGTLLPDAVTDLITYLGTLPSPGAAILVTFSGHYPITD